jgi:tetratricopeptide (TPR) repeat protein
VKKVKTTVNPNDFQQLSKLARGAWLKQDQNGFHALVVLLSRYHANKAETIFLIGLDFKQQGLRTEAKNAFRKALEMDDTRHDAAVELADLEAITGNPEVAYELLQSYAPKLKNSPMYADMAGTCYVNIGLPEKALEMHEIAHALQPDVDIFAGNLAASRGFVGDVEGAKALYEQLLSKNPGHQRNHYHLARLSKARSQDHVEQMKSVLTGDDVRDIFLLNALGKEHEDLRDFDLAFDYYRRAADAVYEQTQHDVEIDLSLLEYQKSRLSSVSPYSERTHSVDEPAPIFIVGLPRTGSTLLEQMLSRHDAIETLGETAFIDSAMRACTNVETGVHRISAAELEDYDRAPDPRFVREYYLKKTQYRLQGKPYFIDKMPYNFLLIDKILEAFPDAIIVNTRRDPIDTCFSMYKQIFTNAYLYSYSLSDLRKYYTAYEEYMQVASNLADPRFLTVQYEDLVTNPESQLREVLERLGLAFLPQILTEDPSRSVSMTASAAQIREGIQTSYRQNWRNFESHLSPLMELIS